MIAVFVNDVATAGRMRVVEAYLTLLYELLEDDVAFINTSLRSTMDSTVPDGMKTLNFGMSGVLTACEEWPSYIDACKDFLVRNDINTVFVLGATMLSGKRYGQEHAIRRDLDRMKTETELRMNFVIMKTFYSRIQFLNACSQVCDNVYHHVIDPLEPDFNEVFGFKNYQEFTDLRFASRRRVLMPYYEWYSFMQGNEAIECKDRMTSFTFGGSAVTAERAFLVELIDDVEEKLSKHGFAFDIKLKKPKAVKENNDKFVDQRQYVYDLVYSVSTLIVPAYDAEAFSWFRLVESVCRGCVPLVYSQCCLDSVRTAFRSLYDFICDELIVDSADDIVAKIETFSDDDVRIATCKKIKNLIAEKHVLDIEWLRDRWSKLDGVARR